MAKAWRSLRTMFRRSTADSRLPQPLLRHSERKPTLCLRESKCLSTARRDQAGGRRQPTLSLVYTEQDPKAGSPGPARLCRDVAQPGRALAWGARGRQFKSARPDHSNPIKPYVYGFTCDLFASTIICLTLSLASYAGLTASSFSQSAIAPAMSFLPCCLTRPLLNSVFGLLGS